MDDYSQLLEPIRRRWATLDSGWQAVCLGFFMLGCVALGVPIPW